MFCSKTTILDKTFEMIELESEKSTSELCSFPEMKKIMKKLDSISDEYTDTWWPPYPVIVVVKEARFEIIYFRVFVLISCFCDKNSILEVDLTCFCLLHNLCMSSSSSKLSWGP